MNKLSSVTMVLGPVETNTFLIYNKASNDCVIIDPSDDADRIAARIEEEGLLPTAIILTHGHFDHITAADELRNRFDIKIYAYEGERELLENPEYNLSRQFLGFDYSLKADVFLKDEEHREFLGLDWRLIHTPGHTSGSVCYYIEEENLLISGDTIMYETYGRYDLYGGSNKAIVASILNKLFVLPEDTLILPGHGRATDMAHEKRRNIVSVYIGREVR